MKHSYHTGGCGRAISALLGGRRQIKMKHRYIMGQVDSLVMPLLVLRADETSNE